MYDDIRLPYQVVDTPTLQLGGILLNEQLLADAPVKLVLKSLNRHGLISGATGTGKTKTIQVITEQLSLLGVPSFVMDIKGDLSGLAMPNVADPKLLQRSQSLNLNYTPRAFPIEMLTLNESTTQGLPLRSTISDFGAVLFSRMLDINDIQTGVVTVLFEYAKENKLPLIGLDDFKALLQFVQTEAGKASIETLFGAVSAISVGAIARKIIELEAQGGDQFFGEPAFDVMDLVRVNEQGLGVISILRLLDMQDKPKLFSTFMLKLLSDVYKLMPELGDPAKPKLMLFIDEAHLMFNNASRALLDLLDTMVKLIRSKGIGLIFCTQTPNDIPENILGQLGLKIQHALRAFTAKDRKAMKLVAQNFPASNYYQTEQLLTALGIGEALVSALDVNGQPTPLIECLVRVPESRMGVLSAEELAMLVSQSALMGRYGVRLQKQSAKDILMAKTGEVADGNNVSAKVAKDHAQEPSMMEQIGKSTLFRQVVLQLTRDLLRSVLSALGIKRR